MSNNIRIRTTPDGDDKYLKVKLEQDFDFIEILSLKISQQEVYGRFCSDYGVVVGRVIVNNGFGVPNAKVSIFIPISDIDREDAEVLNLYPYEVITDTDSDGVRYNLLPNTSQVQDECFTPVGTFPSKRDVLDNNELTDVYGKYYKFTTTTNQSGDFMLFGVPLGEHILHVDADMSDIGVISQKPYDLIREGVSEKKFETVSKFKKDTNLNQLVHVRSNSPIGVTVKPFWGEEDDCDIGISRVDVNLNQNITPHAIFMGSLFGDDDKNAISKRCRPRKKTGDMQEVIATAGRIEMIRKTLDGGVERFDVEGGDVIDDDGVWSYQVPMNLDYMVTNEFGDLIPSNNPLKGLPTTASVRFRIGMNEVGGSGRLRTRAKYLVPNNPNTHAEADYNFDENTSDANFANLSFNKIYTVKSFVPRFNNNGALNSKTSVSIKDVSEATTGVNNFPFNKMDNDLNPIFNILCFIINLIVGSVVFVFNSIILVIINFIMVVLNAILSVICRVIFTVMQIVTVFNTNPNNKRIRRCSACIGTPTCTDSNDNTITLDCSGAIVEGEIITTAPVAACTDQPKCACGEPLGYVPFIVLRCDGQCYAPFAFIRPGKSKQATRDNNADCTVIFPDDPGVEGADAGYFDCITATLAQALDVFEFLFYNDWINGSLYYTLFKYKPTKKGEGREKFCEYDCDEFDGTTNYTGVDNNEDGTPDNKCRDANYLVEGCLCNCASTIGVGCDGKTPAFKDGLIKKVGDEFYYAAITHSSDWKLFATDIVSLGSTLGCDWEGEPSLVPLLYDSTYHLPPLVTTRDDASVEETSGIEPLFANINCLGIDTNQLNCVNIRRYCELGVGDDDNRIDAGGSAVNDVIEKNDIESSFVRNVFAWLNEPSLRSGPLSSVSTDFSTTTNPNCNLTSADANYIKFRFKDGATQSQLNIIDRIKLIKNSFYFYFGLNASKTALRKTLNKYFGSCN